MSIARDNSMVNVFLPLAIAPSSYRVDKIKIPVNHESIACGLKIKDKYPYKIIANEIFISMYNRGD